MLKRKINAGLSLLTTILLLVHAIVKAIWMLSKGSIPISAWVISWALMGAMILHIMISIDLVISVYADADVTKGKKYVQMNRSTVVQRVSGLLLVVFTALHVAGATGYMTPPPIVHAIVPTIFFTVVMVHTAVSTSKAFITLGIGNAKFVRIVDVLVKLVCIVTLIADIIGFYLYVV